MGSEERARRYVSKSDLKEESDEIFKELSKSLSISLTAALSSSLTEILTVELTDSLLPKISEVIGEKLSELTSKVSVIENICDRNAKDIIDIHRELSLLKQESSVQKNMIDTLITKNAELESKIVDQNNQEKIDNLSELIEERTNRQLRQTLVIKGLPEKTNESWDKTTSLLAESFSEVLDDCSFDQARDMINRAHRGPMYDNKRTTRPIYASMH